MSFTNQSAKQASQTQSKKAGIPVVAKQKNSEMEVMTAILKDFIHAVGDKSQQAS